MNQQQVEIAAKMYQARDAVIMLIGEERFNVKVNEFRPILKGICDEHGVSEMQATADILTMLKGRGQETMLAMAACTEIMEPSLKPANCL